ncbi:MBL fold metallo-hydrolase [Salisaeta longa]|uniref:MBL fold metallo-hydrolase n=1 Tax=Salisaeta longa TaxID=503170 RepID=UPI00146DF4E3|nr:MBL fold metallo-hydrolase [Salisaeta longa]
MRWMAGKAVDGTYHRPPAVVRPTSEALAPPPERLRITWLGHATALIQWPHLTLLTDPVFSTRASPTAWAGPERIPALPLDPRGLPPIDGVVLSHDHYDHMDRASLRLLAARDNPLFIAPLGAHNHLIGWGCTRVVPFDWWQFAEVPAWGMTVRCAPAVHFSGRTLTDRNETLWASWWLEPTDATQATVYFGGDSAYSPHFQAIHAHWGTPDAALLPIGAYAPRWMMQAVHVSPEEAVQAMTDLGAPPTVPIHWGTFALSDEPLHEPPERAREAAQAAGIADRLHVLDLGGSFALPT